MASVSRLDIVQVSASRVSIFDRDEVRINRMRGAMHDPSRWIEQKHLDDSPAAIHHFHAAKTRLPDLDTSTCRGLSRWKRPFSSARSATIWSRTLRRWRWHIRWFWRHRRIEEEERPDWCRQDRGLPTLRLPAGVLHGIDRDSGKAPNAALSAPAGTPSGAAGGFDHFVHTFLRIRRKPVCADNVPVR